METGQTRRKDTMIGDMEVSHMNGEKYLCQTIRSDGKILKPSEKVKGWACTARLQMINTMP